MSVRAPDSLDRLDSALLALEGERYDLVVWGVSKRSDCEAVSGRDHRRQGALVGALRAALHGTVSSRWACPAGC